MGDEKNTSSTVRGVTLLSLSFVTLHLLRFTTCTHSDKGCTLVTCNVHAVERVMVNVISLQNQLYLCNKQQIKCEGVLLGRDKDESFSGLRIKKK